MNHTIHAYTAQTGHFMGGKVFFSVMPLEGDRTCIAVAPPTMLNVETPNFSQVKSIIDAGTHGQMEFDVLPERILWAVATVNNRRQVEFDAVHVATLSVIDIASINLLFTELLEQIGEDDGNKELGVPKDTSRHVETCCKIHSCNMGYLHCPVAEEKLEQAYPCQYCPNVITAMEDLQDLLRGQSRGYFVDPDALETAKRELELSMSFEKSII